MSGVELREKAKELRAEAQRYRRSAFLTSEPELQHSYMELAEAHEALASDCDVTAPLPLPGVHSRQDRRDSIHGIVACPLG